MGFGHRVYKNFDPRAILLKDLSTEVGETERRGEKEVCLFFFIFFFFFFFFIQVFELLGKNPLIDVAIEVFFLLFLLFLVFWFLLFLTFSSFSPLSFISVGKSRSK